MSSLCCQELHRAPSFGESENGRLRAHTNDTFLLQHSHLHPYLSLITYILLTVNAFLISSILYHRFTCSILRWAATRHLPLAATRPPGEGRKLYKCLRLPSNYMVVLNYKTNELHIYGGRCPSKKVSPAGRITSDATLDLLPPTRHFLRATRTCLQPLHPCFRRGANRRRSLCSSKKNYGKFYLFNVMLIQSVRFTTHKTNSISELTICLYIFGGRYFDVYQPAM